MAAKADASVLVTGGAGFIGSNLVRELVARGQRVVALDNEYLGRLSNLKGVDCTVVEGDVLHEGLLDDLVTKHGVDRIVHLSGYTSAPMFAEGTRRKILANTEGFLNTLEAARTHSLTVAYASTSSFYARCPKPFREDMLIVPATPYELCKFVMEQAAHTYWHEYGVRANGLRFFSVYGPHEEHKTRYANNISQFFWSIKNGVRPVVFGDGTQTRDFTYVGDLVDGIIRILDGGSHSDVYNIGTGTEHSFNDMVAAINDHLGTDVEPVYVKNPLKNYVQETLADTSKIRDAVRWEATTTLAEGIARIAEASGGLSRAEAEALYDWLPKQGAPEAG